MDQLAGTNGWYGKLGEPKPEGEMEVVYVLAREMVPPSLAPA
jgi:hypothetical protein